MSRDSFAEVSLNPRAYIGQIEDKALWDQTINFLLPSLLEHTPNELIRILWEQSIKRAKTENNNDPVWHFQRIVNQLGIRFFK